jgi:diguanylate cyclase (GGDEF)-like protein
MFDSVLELEWENARRNNQPLALIMLDIDYFKQYNDHYGHIQGDDCLKRVAQTLSHAATRARDFFARFGGEEFMLILPETNQAAAIKVAERCRNLIFKEQIPHAKSEVGQLLTISLGIGAIIPSQQDTPMAFMEEVDRRLYQAKQQGRNRMVHG